MPPSLAQNAIALLIDLAERGEIDPWDVQVIEVIDRFLSQLQPAPTADAGRAPYEADLSYSGQAFLYASMLVLLKADSLARADTQDNLDAEEVEETLLSFSAPLPPNLERQLRRRAVAHPLQQRRVTLPELISQLNLVAKALSERQPRTRTHRPRTPSQSQAMRAIAQLAHQENLAEVAAALEQFLKTYWESEQLEWVNFEDLLQWWTTAATPELGKASPTASHEEPHEDSHEEPREDSHDRVGVFWALLFLSAQSKVELAQEQFYQDLQVRSLMETDLAATLPSLD